MSNLEQEYLEAANAINEQLKIATEALIKAKELANKHGAGVAYFGCNMADKIYNESEGTISVNESIIDERSFKNALRNAGWSASSFC